MCGIAGIYAYSADAPDVDLQELLRSRDSMVSRGPDGAGLAVMADRRLGLAHRRLSLLDLSERGAQPMASHEGRFHITFNGEIYNFRSLRTDLERLGAIFHSETDTEVLLHLYAVHGRNMVRLLRGMFAFAIWDNVEHTLFLARDPYGIKPLYIADDGKTARFASTVGALLAGGGVSQEPDAAGWAGFYLFGSVPQPLTTIKAVRCIPAGSTVIVSCDGAAASERYFSIAETFCRAEGESTKLHPLARQAEFRDAMLDSVRHHLIADVPVGVFLSGGVDSGALVGLMRDCGQTIQAVTLQFDQFRGGGDDEIPGAAVVARQYGAEHVVRRVTADEFQSDLPSILDAMDQPSIDGVNAWFVSKATRELGLKTALSGVGADELIGGYSTFLTVPARTRRLSAIARLPGLGTFAQRFVKGSRRFGLKVHPKAGGMLQYGGSLLGSYFLQRGLFMPWELPQLYDAGVGVALGPDNLDPIAVIASALDCEPVSVFGRMATLESSLYLRNQLLRDADWAGMAHSVEIRTPYVDRVLLDRLAPTMINAPFGAGKALLARSPSSPLPEVVTHRARKGFSLPMADWIDDNGAGLWAREWAKRVASGNKYIQGRHFGGAWAA